MFISPEIKIIQNYYINCHQNGICFGTPELLSTYKAFIRSMMERLPSGLILFSHLLSPLPHILLSLMPGKPKLSRLLESPTLTLSLWVHHFTFADRSVVFLSSTASFLVLHPLFFPCFVPLGLCKAHTVHHIPHSGETT